MSATVYDLAATRGFVEEMTSRETPEYSWTQTPDSMVIRLKVEDDVKKDDVSVRFESRSVRVCVGDAETLSEKTEREIRAESVWLLEKEKDGTYISLDMLKKENEWWCRALKCEKTPVDISELPDLSEKETTRPTPKLEPVGKLGVQSTTKDEFKGKSSFVW